MIREQMRTFDVLNDVPATSVVVLVDLVSVSMSVANSSSLMQNLCWDSSKECRHLGRGNPSVIFSKSGQEGSFSTDVIQW